MMKLASHIKSPKYLNLLVLHEVEATEAEYGDIIAVTGFDEPVSIGHNHVCSW